MKSFRACERIGCETKIVHILEFGESLKPWGGHDADLELRSSVQPPLRYATDGSILS